MRKSRTALIEDVNSTTLNRNSSHTGLYSEETKVRVKTLLELGFSGGKIEQMTGVPMDTVYKWKKGYFGNLDEVQSDPDMKKAWNERRKKFIDTAYDKVEALFKSINEDKIRAADLKMTVDAIAKLIDKIAVMIGTTRSSAEVTEELGFIKSMKDGQLDKFIQSASNTLGIQNGDAALLLKRSIKLTSESAPLPTEGIKTLHPDEAGGAEAEVSVAVAETHDDDEAGNNGDGKGKKKPHPLDPDGLDNSDGTGVAPTYEDEEGGGTEATVSVGVEGAITSESKL